MKVKINEITLNPSAIICVFGSIAFLLVLASISGQLAKFIFGHHHLKGFVFLFDVSSEGNIPTFFSVFLILSAASLLAIISILKRKSKDRYVSKWIILSLGFIYMAYDEAFQVHERLVMPVRNLLGISNGIFSSGWVIPAMIIVCVLVLYFLKFFFHLPAKNRLTFLLSATIYLGGCIGVELIESSYIVIHGDNNLMFNMISTVQESLEMAGIIIFIFALLEYLNDHYTEVCFRFNQGQGKRLGSNARIQL